MLADPFDTAIHDLANLSDGLAPTKMFLNTFALDLADAITGLP